MPGISMLPTWRTRPVTFWAASARFTDFPTTEVSGMGSSSGSGDYPRHAPIDPKGWNKYRMLTGTSYHQHNQVVGLVDRANTAWHLLFKQMWSPFLQHSFHIVAGEVFNRSASRIKQVLLDVALFKSSLTQRIRMFRGNEQYRIPAEIDIICAND